MGKSGSNRSVRRRNRCDHRNTITVETSALRRTICESCGHVSVDYSADLIGYAERAQFARRPDVHG